MLQNNLSHNLLSSSRTHYRAQPPPATQILPTSLHPAQSAGVMSANRSWMYRDIGKKSKHAQEYIRGVEEFLEFAFSHRECVADGMIRCPSNKCEFLNYESKETVQMCLLRYGFVLNYELWTRHGESHVESSSDDDIVDVEEEGNQTWAKEMIMEAAGPDFQPFNENPNSDSKKFYDMYNAADEPLWKDCDTYSTFTTVSQLLHLKSEHGMTIRAFDDILSTIQRMLPKDEKLQDSFYRCKAMMKNLGLPYEKIHACENDCVLFRGENKSFDTCPICGESRYKKHENKSGEQRKPIPRKEEYANKIREKHGLAHDENVTGIEDPGFEIWQECVGRVTRGRLIERPGERWSKTGVSKDYDTHVASQEYLKKLERLEKDNKKKAKREAKLDKIVNSQSSYISEQGSYISEQGNYISAMSQYLQDISEKFGIPAPPPFIVRPPHMPLSTNDGASADVASGVPDGSSSSRGCDDFDADDNDDNDDESEPEDD